MLEFSYRPQFFYGFFRREGRSDGSDGTVIEWDRDVDIVVAEKSLEAVIQELYEK